MQKKGKKSSLATANYAKKEARKEKLALGNSPSCELRIANKRLKGMRKRELPAVDFAKMARHPPYPCGKASFGNALNGNLVKTAKPAESALRFEGKKLTASLSPLRRPTRQTARQKEKSRIGRFFLCLASQIAAVKPFVCKIINYTLSHPTWQGTKVGDSSLSVDR